MAYILADIIILKKNKFIITMIVLKGAAIYAQDFDKE
jgi:hypothetical protein